MKFQKTPIALAAFALCAAAPFAAQAAPSVSFTSPQAGATIGQNSNYVCAATATNASRVQFSLVTSGGVVKPINTDSSSPYNCAFNSYHYLDGSWTLRAVATDASGATATANIPVTINNKGTSTTPPPPPAANPGPTVTFVKPANNATVSGPIACEVTAVDPDGIQKVDWLLDGRLIGTETSAPFNFCNMSTTGLTTGAHIIKARATDKKGAATEAQVTVNVGTTPPPPPPAANPGPTVTFLKPASNATVSGAIACEVTAVDPDGIQKVEWILDGNLIYTETSAPFNYCNMNATGLTPGAHTIKARATDKKGAATEAQVTVNVAGGTPPPPPPGGPVDPADIKTRASADVVFSEQPNIYTDVLGSTPWMSTIPETGRHGTVLANGETLRFGKEADPLNSARQAMTFQLASSDPNTGGSKRVELGFPRQIEMDKVYWIALSVYVHDWGTLGTSDQSLFGFQLHSGSKLDLSPTIALYTTKDGRTFKVSTRWSTSSTPGQSNSVSAHYAEQAIPFGRWMDFVVKFKQNTSGSGFAQVWMDGNLIVDHQGNLGFNTPGFLDFVKWGYYNWSGSGFSSTSRKVRLRNPTIVADPTGSKYSAADVRGLLGTDAGASAASTGTTPATSPATSTVASGTGGTAPASSGGVCSTITCAAQ